VVPLGGAVNPLPSPETATDSNPSPDSLRSTNGPPAPFVIGAVVLALLGIGALIYGLTPRGGGAGPAPRPRPNAPAPVMFTPHGAASTTRPTGIQLPADKPAARAGRSRRPGKGTKPA
jgi:hypothetical protein